ncbi:hypothetical protein BGZ72_007241, partial [Mortierella alpina]
MPLRIKHCPGVVLDVVEHPTVPVAHMASPTAVPVKVPANAPADATASVSTEDRVIEALQVPSAPVNTSLNYDIRVSSPPASSSSDAMRTPKTALSFKDVVRLASKKAPGSDVQLQLQEVNTKMARVIKLQEALDTKQEEMKQLQNHSIEQQDEMKRLQMQVLTQQEDMKELQIQALAHQEELKQLQIQALGQLALLQTRVQAVLTQTYELHEYPIPRLFIVLPACPSKWDILDPFANKYRLYFLCECGEHTKKADSNNKIPHEIHLAKHEGYEILQPSDFFQQYGPYLLTILQMLRFGISVAGFAVPALSHRIIADTLDQAVDGLQKLKDDIEPGMEQVMSYIEKASVDDGKAIGEEQMENNEALEGADLRKLETFLKAKDGSKVLGNLYRTVTDEGHVKWVCVDHYRENYNRTAAEAFRRAVDTVDGLFDENTGVVKVLLQSKVLATHFYAALEKARSVHELDISLGWGCTRSDVELLADALRRSRVPILRLDLEQFQTDFGTKLLSTNAQYGALFRVAQLPNMKVIHIILPKKFDKHLSLLPKKPSHLHKLFFEMTFESLTGEETEVLATRLKDNSALTTLTLKNSEIGDTGAWALAGALKTNTTLTTLDLWSTFIGENGARALSEALKTNTTLTTLYLWDTSIGENGALALAESLKTNTTLATLDLGNDLIGYIGAQALAQALEINTSLTTLNLWDPSIGASGAQVLAEVLKTSNT